MDKHNKLTVAMSQGHCMWQNPASVAMLHNAKR